ncbi:MAG: chloride channel protein [Sulfobacillus sp.]
MVGRIQAKIPEPVLLILLALLVGGVGGLGAVVFRLMIQVAGSGLGFIVHGALRLPPAGRLIEPVLGLMAVGVITTYFAREVKGHGVPQILEALALRGGRIRKRVGFWGIVAPAITIGAGGSVGREGPIALIGAAFGSTLGQVTKLADRYIMLLVGAGAAAGIGATFNAPIAGALFGMEVVLGSYAMGTLVPCMVASVVGVTVFNAILGNHLALPLPNLGFRSPFSIVVMALVGVLAGLLAVLYTRGLTWAEDLFDRHHLQFWHKALLGGLVVGALGLALPQVLGVGYGPMELVGLGKITGVMVLLLLVAKFVATITTIGAGGSGGVFAPSLYLGLMLGTTVGTAAHGLFPGSLADARSFGVAGMGAVFAAAAQAPLTAAVIVLEMTGAYQLTLGVAMASAIAYFLYGSLQRDTMYTVRLSRRGIRILRGSEVRPLETMSVRTAMRPVAVRLTGADSLLQAQEAMGELHADAILVEDSDGIYQGVLEAPTVLAAPSEGSLSDPISSVALNRVPALRAEDSLDDAMRRFALYDTEILPVADNGKLIGVLSRGGVMQSYQAHTALSLETSQKVAMLRQTDLEPGALRVLAVGGQSEAVGLSIKDLKIPLHLVIVAIERGDQVVTAKGDTMIEADDRLMVYANPPEEAEKFARYLTGH